MNKDGSSKQLKSIKITINDSKQIGFFSQLDVNDAIEILERCLKDLQKEKAYKISSTNLKGILMQMKKEDYRVVKEVNDVLEVMDGYNNIHKDISYKEWKKLYPRISKLLEDYKLMFQDLLDCNSSLMKLEKFVELIGIISTISTDDEDVMDKSLKVLNKYVQKIEMK